MAACHCPATYLHCIVSCTAGVPLFMRHMPVMGGLLRGGIARVVVHMLEDMNTVLDLVRFITWCALVSILLSVP